MPAANPFDVAKGMALLLAPVKVPVPFPVASFAAWALLGPISVGVMDPLPVCLVLMRRRVIV